MKVDEETALDSLRLEALRDNGVYGKEVGCADDGIIPCAAARTGSPLGTAAETMGKVSSFSKCQEEAATKACIGGYRNSETKCSYFNASTQFGRPFSQECNHSRRMELSTSRCDRETQTANRRSQYVKTRKEHGTQLSPRGQLLDCTEGKVVISRPYITPEQIWEQQAQNIITIQRYWRKYMARQLAIRMRRQIENEQQHRENLAEMRQATNKKEQGRIKKKVSPNSNKLDIASKPQLWETSNGLVVQVYSPMTMHSKELKRLQEELMISQKGEKAHEDSLKVLLSVKEEINKMDSLKIAQELRTLVDREINLLNRGRKEATFVNLRIRITSLFEYFCEALIDKKWNNN